ncbi:Hsp33 family molecular chaperone HslO [Butyrivibrio sp. MC2013]|uniref:Hsp33 family molecular chaperone HslO n=1 Tax=Butyrivibrio sp. MC2013 TaxID=1280686 RepID=UPI000427B377|nr:Hsp33 family molecular chaperone HslO [Butyrivibrio sp. MC2013]
MEYKDYMVRATAAGDQIRAFAITSRDLTEEARKAHGSSPIVTAALGRLMSASLMMAAMTDNEDDLLTVRIEGDGPMGGLLATADCKGNVKGYATNELVIMPPNEQGHLNVGGAIGKGSLTVIKDMGLKDPYVGQVPLQTGEIAEDITYYYAQSEQTPSSVGLGVLMNPENNTVREAGGFIIQLLPFAADDVIDKLEANLKKFSSVTDVLREGKSPEDLLRIVLEGFDINFTDKKDVNWYCNCSKERMERGLILLGRKELDDIITQGEGIETKCRFCNESYRFSLDEIKAMREKSK